MYSDTILIKILYTYIIYLYYTMINSFNTWSPEVGGVGGIYYGI